MCSFSLPSSKKCNVYYREEVRTRRITSLTTGNTPLSSHFTRSLEQHFRSWSEWGYLGSWSVQVIGVRGPDKVVVRSRTPKSDIQSGTPEFWVQSESLSFRVLDRDVWVQGPEGDVWVHSPGGVVVRSGVLSPTFLRSRVQRHLSPNSGRGHLYRRTDQGCMNPCTRYRYTYIGQRSD